MKIKHVKMYQAVKFAGSQQTYFNAEEFSDKTAVNTVHCVKIEKTPTGILFYNDLDCIEVYQTNIAFVQYTSSPEKMESKPKKVS